MRIVECIAPSLLLFKKSNYKRSDRQKDHHYPHRCGVYVSKTIARFQYNVPPNGLNALYGERNAVPD